jgi:hypothetical protein
MEINTLSKEQKDRLLTELLTDGLKSEPARKTEILALIENITKSQIDREIEDWAKKTNY